MSPSPRFFSFPLFSSFFSFLFLLTSSDPTFPYFLFIYLLFPICSFLFPNLGGVVGSLQPGGIPTEVEARASIGTYFSHFVFRKNVDAVLLFSLTLFLILYFYEYQSISLFMLFSDIILFYLQSLSF